MAIYRSNILQTILCCAFPVYVYLVYAVNEHNSHSRVVLWIAGLVAVLFCLAWRGVNQVFISGALALFVTLPLVYLTLVAPSRGDSYFSFFPYGDIIMLVILTVILALVVRFRSFVANITHGSKTP